MFKSILEEIIIALLLCLVIIVVLGIILYEYVPVSKTVPTPIEYVTSETVKEQLAEAEALDESQVVLTYEVNSSDLSNYKRTQNYQPGKADPFAAVAIQDVTESGETGTTGTSTSGTGTTGTTGTTSGSTGTSTSGTTTTENTSGGTFFQNTGTK